MADGTFAALLLIVGLTDMGLNHCGTPGGCLAADQSTPRLSLSGGEVLERRADTASEVYVRYDLGTSRGPFGWATGLSVGEAGETWVGLGATYEIPLGQSGFYTELHTMPGLYFDNGGFDLGGPVAFRSGIELGYETGRGMRFAVSYDHRSNAGLFDENPGVETVQAKVSIPLR